MKKTNTAKFESFTAETGGTKTGEDQGLRRLRRAAEPEHHQDLRTRRQSTSTVDGHTIYAYSPRRPRTRPPLHDVTIVDCVPDTLTVKAVSPAPGSLDDQPEPARTTNKARPSSWGPFDPLTPGWS